MDLPLISQKKLCKKCIFQRSRFPPIKRAKEEKRSLWDRRCDRWLGKRDSSGVLVAQSGRKRLMVSVMDGHAPKDLQ